jgi:hypothetical protein
MAMTTSCSGPMSLNIGHPEDRQPTWLYWREEGGVGIVKIQERPYKVMGSRFSAHKTVIASAVASHVIIPDHSESRQCCLVASCYSSNTTDCYMSRFLSFQKQNFKWCGFSGFHCGCCLNYIFIWVIIPLRIICRSRRFVERSSETWEWIRDSNDSDDCWNLNFRRGLMYIVCLLLGNLPGVLM